MTKKSEADCNDASKDGREFDLNRRTALSLLGLGSLGILSAGTAAAQERGGPPFYNWREEVDANGNDLTALGSLIMESNSTPIQDFAGENLTIQDGVLNATSPSQLWDDSDDDDLLEIADYLGIDISTVKTQQISNIRYARAYSGDSGGEKIQNAIAAADAAAGPNLVVVDGAGPDDVSGSSGAVSDVRSESAWKIVDTPEIPSNTTLLLANCYLFVADGADDSILRNRAAENGGFDENISIVGLGNAVLDGNKDNQTIFDRESGPAERNIGIRFWHINDLEIRGLTLRNTAGWGIKVEDGKEWHIENIRVDQNGGPNQDGVHLIGPCDDATVTDIRGTSGDDMVAVNADDPDNFNEGDGGYVDLVNISNIRGRTQGDYSMVRIWGSTTSDYEVRNINASHISYTGYGEAVRLGFRDQVPDSLFGVSVSDVTVRRGADAVAVQADSSQLSLSSLTTIDGGSAVYINSGVTVDDLSVTDVSHDSGDALLYVGNDTTVNRLRFSDTNSLSESPVITRESNESTVSGVVRDVQIRSTESDFQPFDVDAIRFDGGIPVLDVRDLPNVRGSEAFHDGSGSGPIGPAFNSGKGWQSLVDNSSITE